MSLQPLFSVLVEDALRLAARSHAAQMRKSSDIPYVTHLAGVALILSRAGFCDETILAAAILHDVAEDTEVTLEELADRFPLAVLELVEALTETKYDGQSLRPWEDRKRDHLQQVARAAQEARAIALADKLHNLETMVLDLDRGALDLSVFRAPPERLLWYHERMIEAAAGTDAELQPLATAARDAWERLREYVTKQTAVNEG